MPKKLNVRNKKFRTPRKRKMLNNLATTTQVRLNPKVKMIKVNLTTATTT